MNIGGCCVRAIPLQKSPCFVAAQGVADECEGSEEAVRSAVAPTLRYLTALTDDDVQNRARVTSPGDGWRL